MLSDGSGQGRCQLGWFESRSIPVIFENSVSYRPALTSGNAIIGNTLLWSASVRGWTIPIWHTIISRAVKSALSKVHRWSSAIMARACVAGTTRLDAQLNSGTGGYWYLRHLMGAENRSRMERAPSRAAGNAPVAKISTTLTGLNAKPSVSTKHTKNHKYLSFYQCRHTNYILPATLQLVYFDGFQVSSELKSSIVAISGEMMEVRVDTELTIGDLIEYQREQFLRVNPEYQRGLRWTEMQKRMFIDSIFRGYSIPAFYIHKKQAIAGAITNTHFDIVDGQQRIDAIFSFSEGAFPLLDPNENTGFHFPNFVKDDPCPWAGKRFDDLSSALKEQLKNHKVVVYEITTENENSIRDLFIRLQGGTPLTPQDKRDSWPGKFTEFVLRIGGKSRIAKWPGLPIFTEISKTSNESRRRQLVAQVFMLFSSVRNDRKFCDIKSLNIDDFYHAHVDFDDKSDDAERFVKICEILYEALQGKPRIVGHYIIHLFLLVDSLLTDYTRGWESHLANKLFEFEKCRKESADAVRNNQETEYEQYYTEYGQWTQTRSDNANNIRRRHAFFTKEMQNLLSPKKKDPVRSFSDLERQTVFFRDMEYCQWCRMRDDDHKVNWMDSDIHHVLPHSQGGQTTIENAALVHRDCHPKIQSDVEEFEDWWLQRNPMSIGVPNSTFRKFPPPNGTKTRFKYNERVYFGQIKNERLVLSGVDGVKSCKSFSAASRAITGTSRNGWKDWELMIPNDSDWILAEDWRRRN